MALLNKLMICKLEAQIPANGSLSSLRLHEGGSTIAPMNQYINEWSALTDAIMEALAPYGIKPLQSSVVSFANCLMERKINYQRDRSALLARNAVFYTKMDILRFIKEAQDVDDMDEAIWRAFLAAYFGRPSADPNHPGEVESAGRFLCAFGDKPTWTWTNVSAQGDTFLDQLSAHQTDLDALHFGNHRKRRTTHKPDRIAKVVTSFVQVVRGHGGSPSATFTPEEGRTPQKGFDQLYYRFLEVNDFGRTGCFDLLCLLGDMGLLNIEPDSCYLVGSTGPGKGAEKLCGKRPLQKLNTIMDDLVARLGISYAVMEDALCRWQKDPKKWSGELPRDVMHPSLIRTQDIQRTVRPG
jgi:hypothetical protein